MATSRQKHPKRIHHTLRENTAVKGAQDALAFTAREGGRDALRAMREFCVDIGRTNTLAKRNAGASVTA